MLLVSGFWEGLMVIHNVFSILEAQGFSTKISVLHSTGTTSAGNPGMKDDIAGVRAVVEKHIDTNEDDILVFHPSAAHRTRH